MSVTSRSRRLGDLTWGEVVCAGRLLVVPLGATEQHGPHLPMDTDTVIAVALAEALAERRDVTVAPAIPVGASGEHAGFPGTLSLGREALERALVELVRGADDWAGVLLVSWHGGNAEAVRGALALLHHEGRRVDCAPGPVNGLTDLHAGRTETSLMLALDPDRVRLDRAAAGNTASLTDLLPRMRAEGVRAVSASGVLGDPAGATADEGRALLEALAADLVARADALVAA